MSWQQRYHDRFYRRDPSWIDGTTQFFRLCGAHIPLGSRILEIGAGPSNPVSRHLKTLGRLDGLDIDEDVAHNDALERSWVFDGGRFPLEDGSFDACVSNYVMEHVPDPLLHLREVHRVLRPGGAYVFRTPNRYHYVAIVASLTPHWFHELVANRVRGLSAESHAPYPTHYAMNTSAAVRRFASRAAFDVAELQLVEKEPSYGMASRLMFLGGMAYERAVNATEHLADLRSNLFVALRARTGPGVTGAPG